MGLAFSSSIALNESAWDAEVLYILLQSSVIAFDLSRHYGLLESLDCGRTRSQGLC